MRNKKREDIEEEGVDRGSALSLGEGLVRRMPGAEDGRCGGCRVRRMAGAEDGRCRGWLVRRMADAEDGGAEDGWCGGCLVQRKREKWWKF